LNTKLTNEHGFSLVELSIVLIIIGLLVGTAAVPLSSSINQSRYKYTTAQLENIREAMHGYLISTGKLPCPVSIDFSEQVGLVSDGICATQHGAVPATTLGVMGERSANGALLDVWGRAYRYSVSLSDHAQLGVSGEPDWLTIGEPAAVGAQNMFAELQLCRTTAANDCANKDLIANQIAWVVYSTGANDGVEALEAENVDNDHVFAVSGYSSSEEHPFDDQIIWASRSELVYWLLKASWLP